MRYRVTHKTLYEYDNPVSISHHVLRLTPRALPGQSVLGCQLSAEPAPAALAPYEDYFGNTATFVTIEGPHRQLAVLASSEVQIDCGAPPDPAATPAWEQVRDAIGQNGSGRYAASEFVFPSPLIPRQREFAQYAEASFTPARPVLEGATDLMGRIHRDFLFDTSATTAATPLEQVFRRRRGVCQDFAQFQIACLRGLGLPARYVSGYLETLPPPGQDKLVGADASHAWLQLWCGEPLGWIALDPTNNLLPASRHVTVAWGRDFGDVSPLRRVLVGSGGHQLSVAVDVLPVAAPTPPPA